MLYVDLKEMQSCSSFLLNHLVQASYMGFIVRGFFVF